MDTGDTSSAPSLAPGRFPGRWAVGAPYLAVVAFAAVMLALVWALQAEEVRNQRAAVTRDVQWAEQTIRLHTQSTEEFLGQLAREIGRGSLTEDEFRSRAAQFMVANPELESIVWVDVGERARWNASEGETDWPVGDHLHFLQLEPFSLALKWRRAVYGPPYVRTRDHWVIDVFAPVTRGGRPFGAVVGVYGADRMVRHLIPGWLGDKYRIALIGPEGVELAANGAMRALDETLDVQLPLDPPGHGLVLRATALQRVGGVPRSLPTAAIAGLSVLMLWSLWVLRGSRRGQLQMEKERDRLFNFSLDPLCVVGLDSVFRRCNPAFETVLGYSPEDLPGRNFLDLIHPKDLPGAVEQLRALAAGQPVRFELRCRCADGYYKWLAWSFNPVLDERLIYGVGSDVTARKAAEEALQAESSFRKAMEDSMVTGMRAIDMEGRITYVNRAFCRMVGLGAEELVGALPPFPYWPVEEMDLCARYLALTLAGRAPPGGFEMRVRRKDGERIDTRFYLSPLIDTAGVQTGWMAAVTDITEPKRIRANLEAAQQRFEAVLDGLETAVFVADARTDEILFANRAFKVIHGFDAVGRSARGAAVPQPERGDYRVDPRNLGPQDVPTDLFDGELQHPLSGRWYHVRELATRWVDGRVVRMGVATEITDRKHMEQVAREQEERLASTSRLITMGEMASTLAHELNQPLAAITNYSMGCVTRLRSGHYRPEDLLGAMEKAASQAERAGKIIRRIRDFVRKSEPRRAAVSLAEVMDDAQTMAELNTRRAGVKLVVDVPDTLPAVFADRIMVEQVVLNLLRNGAEAMAATPAEARVLEVRAREVAGGMVQVSVADRGHGISDEDLERLFKPFFTTKAEGMGMGLNICRSIIEFHGGRLWVEPNPDGGTIFHFTLPLETAGVPFAESA